MEAEQRLVALQQEHEKLVGDNAEVERQFQLEVRGIFVNSVRSDVQYHFLHYTLCMKRRHGAGIAMSLLALASILPTHGQY